MSTIVDYKFPSNLNKSIKDEVVGAQFGAQLKK
jgi:hypothetical protein